jgi:hypothetical protein
MKTFDFWRENKTTRHFQLTENELLQLFPQWLNTKDIEWINYYNSERVIRSFITEDNGLNSVHEQTQFEDLYKLLQPQIIKYEAEVKQILSVK